MDRDDVIDLLSIISAADHRTVGEPDVELWQRIVGTYSKDDCLDAVMAHLKECPGVWLEPGHVAARVKAIIRDRYERSDPDTRDAWRDLGGTRAIESEPAVSTAFSDAKEFLLSGAWDKRQEKNEVTAGRRNHPSMKVKCKHCKAKPSRPCVDPSTGRPLRYSVAHPSRCEAAGAEPDFAAAKRARKAWQPS